MELNIDGKPCDLGSERIAVPGYAAAALADVEAAREGRSLTLTIPATMRNDALAGFARDPHTAERFNATLHTAELTAEGSVMLSGTVRMLSASDEGYRIEIRDGGAGWAKNAARRMFNALGVDFRAALTPETILAGWTDDSPVKFFPIRRDEYPQRNSPTDLLPAQRLLTVDDYHPFLHVATLVETIFGEAGYRIESRFMESELFRSLYMSGAYASRDTAALAARMGFFARRLSSATAKADYSGRVAANPNTALNSVGNIVETATPQTPDADGEPVPGLSNNGGCFGFDRGNIVFTPTTEVSAGFEYYLKYTTDHVIQSRQRLKGFDSVYLGTGADMRFSLANRYEDRRGGIAQNRSYTAIVFDHAEGRQYRLSYTRNGTADTLWSEFAARTAQVVTPAAGSVANPVLQVRSGTAGSRTPGIGRCTTGISPSGRDHRRTAGAHRRRAAFALVTQIFQPDLLPRGRGGHVAHPAQGMFAPAAFLIGARIRVGDHVRRRGPAPDPSIGTARSAAAPLQPALPHRAGDKNRADRTGGRFLRRRSRGRLAGENRLLAARGAGGHRPRSPRTPHMALSGGRRSRGPFRRRG
ncbi:MAG: hypothetical protein ACLUNN_07055 [Alistipes finegoldii]